MRGPLLGTRRTLSGECRVWVGLRCMLSFHFAVLCQHLTCLMLRTRRLTSRRRNGLPLRCFCGSADVGLALALESSGWINEEDEARLLSSIEKNPEQAGDAIPCPVRMTQCGGKNMKADIRADGCAGMGMVVVALTRFPSILFLHTVPCLDIRQQLSRGLNIIINGYANPFRQIKYYETELMISKEGGRVECKATHSTRLLSSPVLSTSFYPLYKALFPPYARILSARSSTGFYSSASFCFHYKVSPFYKLLCFA